MSTRMLIDARHPEETRVTVVKGSRVEEFDYESASKRPLKGNIYLARVTRVEPSLQAAFVEYGGNRHGFLAFSEIHPDYYQIPVEDRQELIEAETKAALERSQELDATLEEEVSEEPKKKPRRGRQSRKTEAETVSDAAIDNDEAKPEDDADAKSATEVAPDDLDPDAPAELDANEDVADGKESDEEDKDEEIAEAAARRHALRALKRRYSIQEVIKRRQVLLVQVVKEERGNKGAALTTYMSLAGRYCVLMPNSTHAGGISRKISNASDRRSLKKIISSLEVPDEMGLIVRTAGMERTKTEIKRDYDYLLRLWNGIRELTLQSVAPALVYEEGNLIKRTIRDLYSRDIDEIQVEGDEGYRAAKDFMKLLMPSHAKKVQHYQDPIPLYHRYQVESALEAMYQPVVQLRSGGYIVINPTEALISIDVNSGRSTKEHNIEETALKTNMEAAEEVARQLRLRDMAGLVVIDFIDMEERSNNRSVERRMKEVLKNDRARIQIGRISSFGLMEMSRQRLRSNLLEVSMETCTRCSGTGIVRSIESASLMALRSLEEEGIRGRSSVVRVAVCPEVAVYLLNKKRSVLAGFETRYHYEIEVLAQPSMGPSDIEITREARAEGSIPPSEQIVKPDTEAADMPVAQQSRPESQTAKAEDEEDRPPRKRRRRRRRRRNGEDQVEGAPAQETQTESNADDTAPDAGAQLAGQDDGESDAERRPRRRRGSRGGRRRTERNRPEQPEGNETVEKQVVDEGPDTASPEIPGDQSAQTSAEPDAEDTAPRRRRRRVRKPEVDESAEPANQTAAANVDKDAAPDLAAETAPKPRRARRKKADASETQSDAAAEPKQVAADPDASEKPAPAATPRRRGRKPANDAAETRAETGEAAEAVKAPRTRRKKAVSAESPEAEPAEAVKKPAARKRTPARPRKTATDKPVADTPVAATEAKPAANADVAKTPPVAENTGGGDDQPKRRGWWQRTFG